MVKKTVSCCPSRPAHSRSRAFFQAAASLALIAGGLSGSLSTQAMAVDFNNPSGSTVGSQYYANGAAPLNFSNAGTVGGVNASNNPSNPITNFNNSGLISAYISLALYDFSTITNLNNTGTISGDYTAMQLNNYATIGSLNNTGIIRGVSGGSATWTRGIDIQQTCSIGTLTNSGTLEGYQYGIMNLSGGSITTLSNSGTISGFDAGIYNRGSIGTLSNSGTIIGTNGTAIRNSGTITTLNLLQDSVLNGYISNSGTIGTLNVYKIVTSGNFNSSSLAPTIYGNQPGVTNRYATVNSGTTVGTFTNSVLLNTLTNAGIISTLSNSNTIGTLTNSGTITTLTLLSGSSITNNILNSGSIGTLNFHKTVSNGDFNTSSFVASVTGNQPGVTNCYATVNSGTTVGTFTNSVVLNTLTNAGTITTLTNSGTIGSITNTGTIVTLNLLSGSTVTSGISNTGAINILNLTVTGISCNNYDIELPGITGNQPLAVNFIGLPTTIHTVSVIRNGRRASVDTSGFGANTNAIRHVSNSIGRLANTNGVIQSIGTKIAKHYADPYVMTSDLCADGAPAQPGQIGNSDFWIRGFTGRNKVDATASSVDYINTYSGGAVGIERDWSENTRAGAFIGAGITDNSLGGGLGGSEADLLFAGAYATKTWGTLFAKVGLTGGRGNNTNTRNIAAATPEIALADFNSWYVSPEVSIGKVYDLGQHLGGTFSVTPVLSVRYVYAHQDGYTETGATNNLTMNNSHSTTIEERAELKFSYVTMAFNDYGVKVNASVGGIGQQNSGGAMSGTLLGAPLSFATPGDDNTTGFVGGLGFEINRGKYTFTASGDYVRLGGGNADLSANVVFSVKF
jgi:hypothetical protein